MEPLENVFEPGEWDDYGPGPAGWCTKPRRLVRTPGRRLTMSVYVLEPGERHLPYHFHHGAEELLLVLEGTPTLRTPEGERQLNEGDVVCFPRGKAGAHQVWNGSDSPIRVLMLSTLVVPDIVEFLDTGKVGARSAAGERIMFGRPGPELDYWEGEE